MLLIKPSTHDTKPESLLIQWLEDRPDNFGSMHIVVATRYSPYLRRYYERIKRHRGSGKAIIATSRKLLGIIYNTLKNDWIFEDFPNFVIAKT